MFHLAGTAHMCTTLKAANKKILKQFKHFK